MESWHRNKRPFWLLGLPPAAWLSLFFLVPLLLIWAFSFGEKRGLLEIAVTGSLENYLRALDPLYLQIFAKSFWFAFLTTLACLLVGFPVAMPGILSGLIITFIPALGSFLTPDLLGGTDSQMIANVFERQFMTDVNAQTDPIIRIEGVSKRFGSNVIAVDDVHLDIHSGEFFALLGPSGCGKTTLLRMLAGLEDPSDGRIRIDGSDMAGVAPNQRNVNMVFQSYAVFPHMSVFDNVAYGLKVSGTARAEIPARVEDALSLVKLEGFAERRPDQLSGGQRQRGPLARALVKRPRVLLLDEPLSALDAKLREAMQLELVKLQQNVGITFIIVTHDQDEALSMADRIAVMEQGRVRQVAPPHQLYEAPVDRFVADFIGKMNLLQAQRAGGSARRAEFPDLDALQVDCPEAIPEHFSVALRPEKVRVHSQRPTEPPSVVATVEAVVYHGSESRVYARVGGSHGSESVQISATLPNSSRAPGAPHPGERIWLAFSPADLVILAD